MLKITLKRSGIGRPGRQKRILKALGLTRLNKTVLKENNPQMKGMVKAVSHLVEMEEEK